MSRMNEQSQYQEERENLSGMDLCEKYHAEQEALPDHKRDGYAERLNEISDDKRKADKEERMMK